MLPFTINHGFSTHTDSETCKYRPRFVEPTELNRTLVVIAGILALIGLIVNVAFDLDNVYDMTATVIWVLTLIFAFAGAYLGGKKKETPAQKSPTV